MKTLNEVSRLAIKGVSSILILLGTFSSGLAQMSGTYTITGTSDFLAREFESFSEAVDSLTSQGVITSVVINADPGTYDENFRIPAITGASGSNTITFQSATGDSNDVILQHSGFDTANYIVYFVGAGYITIQNMTFNSTLSTNYYNCRIMYLDNEANDPDLGSHHITIRNNLFYSKEQWDYSNERGQIIGSYQEGAHDILIDNNLFSKGESAVSLHGTAGSGQLTGIQITNNTAINQRERSMHFNYLIAPVISGNTIIQTQWQDRGGISLNEVTQGLRVLGNTIDMIQPGESCIRLINCDGAPSGDQRGLIANNMVRADLEDAAAYAVRLEDCSNQRIYNNSVRVRGDVQSDSRALYVHGGSSENIEILNNILQNSARGYTVYIASTAYVSAIGHNNYPSNSNLFARWGGTNYADLESFVAATGETGSLKVPPNFEADDILYAESYWLDNAGSDLTSAVPEDIDGVTRPATPCIGANEFTATELPLAGTYTVGGTSPSYATLGEAIQDLNLRGVSAPVFFNLRIDAPFVEKNYLATYGGASEVNRITFQSDPEFEGNAVISYAGTYNGDQTLGMGSASYITFKNLTIAATNQTNGVVFDFYGYCSHDSIIGCTINGAGRSGSDNVIESNNNVLSEVHFVGNTINNGYRGIFIDGFDSRYAENISMVGNTFNDQYYNGIYLMHADRPVIRDNKVNCSSGAGGYYSGIYLDAVSNDFNILGNRIINDNGNDNGIYINNCTASQSFPSLIANNFVAVDNGADITGIRTNNTNWCNIYHNSVSVKESNSNDNSEAFENSGGSHINLLNNIFASFGYGKAITNSTSSAIDLSDYNCLFAARKTLVSWNGDHGRLIDHQTTNLSMDQNSISVNPMFVSSNDLHVNSSFVDNMGNTGSTGITTDIDGNVRSSPPDIGADEFSATRAPIPGGIYSVGTSGDYSTLKEALDSLQKQGIAGPVTFQLKTQQFNEWIPRVLEIPGASATDTIVIESESGNPEDVLIYYSTSSNEKNVIGFVGVDYMTFRNLSVTATGASDGRPIVLTGFVENLRFVNNRFSSANTSASNFVISNCIVDNLLLKDNTITKGNNGISFSGDQNRNSTNTQIVGNTINEPYNTGILITYNNAPKLINNVIYNKEQNSFEGIQMEYCKEDLVISGNRINSNGSQYGIYLNQCKATDPFSGLISNNTVHVGGTSSYAYGLYLNNCERMNLYHNSSHISGTSTNYGFAIYIRDANLHINVVNNVASNTGGGYAYYVNDGSDIDVSDYNDLYASGTNLARWGGTACTDLAALKTASGKEANSIEADPLFYSNSDLHSMQKELHQKATPQPEVTYDADSVLRDTEKPDLGAFEFTCVEPTFDVWISPTCLGDSTMLIDSSLNIAPGSTRGWDFTGDLVTDVNTENDYDTIFWKFDQAGNNTVTYIVQQIAGCNDYVNLNVSITPSPLLEITTTGAYCDTADGTANVHVSNLEGPFKYYWSDGQTDSLATGLALGTYTVAVSDETGCTSTEEVVIGEAIVVTVEQNQPSTCGVDDGSATVTATGGYEPYRYVWSNGETTATNNVLSPGAHYVNVIDNKGCYAQGSINISSEGGPQISLVGTSDNDCYGDRNGSIDISISEGVPPYDIRWSNGSISEDITGLAAGTYNVTVKDAEGCQGAGSFQVIQPAQIAISPVVTPATCNGFDGTATAEVSGGYKPYTYQWSSGGTFRIEEGLEAGIYSVTVTDGRGCKMKEPVLVNNQDAPDVSITEVKGVGCITTDNGAINIAVTPLNPFYTYSWSSGQTSSNVSGLTEGTYEVTVTDENGCKGVNQAVIRQEPPERNEICIVTVDTALGMNVVVWEKDVTEDVSYYNIYRESSVRDQYLLIGSVGIDEESIFVDSVADPTVRSWRYKLSVVDECGNESELSKHHKTMHLTMNVGTNDVVNLNWDHYEGDFQVETYKIMRSTAPSVWASLTDLSSINTSYSDQDIPANYPEYFIEIERSGGCTTSDRKAATYNHSRSNRKTKLKSGTFTEDLMHVSGMRVYPNPSSGLFNLSMDMNRTEDLSVRILDITGKLVMTREYSRVPHHLDAQFDLSELPDGIYQIHVRTGNVLLHRILIKE